VAASSLSLSGITGSSAVISQSRHFPKFAESRRTKAVVMQKDVQATAATILASAVRRTRLYSGSSNCLCRFRGGIANVVL
jgi:hypothetical protein